MPDTDTIPGLAGNVRAAEDRIRDRFKATSVDVDTDADGVTARLQFRGFTDLDDALTRVDEVARELNELEETTEVHAGINTSGGYDPHTEETDDRPMGWVNATLETEGADP